MGAEGTGAEGTGGQHHPETSAELEKRQGLVRQTCTRPVVRLPGC